MMRNRRRLVILAAGLALGAGALGVPAAANEHPAQVAIVQGWPGERLDLCLNGKEIRSRAGYGSKTILVLDPGSYTLKAFVRDPRKCKGTKVAQRSFDLIAHGDLSMVVARGKPKVVLFDNDALQDVGPAVHQAWIVWRHAAKAKAVNFYVPDIEPTVPASSHTKFRRGDSAFRLSSTNEGAAIWVTPHGKEQALAGPKLFQATLVERHEFYFIGTKPSNYRLVSFSRPTLAPF